MKHLILKISDTAKYFAKCSFFFHKILSREFLYRPNFFILAKNFNTATPNKTKPNALIFLSKISLILSSY